MAFAFQGQVDPENEDRMRGYYETLSEKDGRRFAVLQARLLGYGGITSPPPGIRFGPGWIALQRKTMQTFVVGDIHGKRKPLENLISWLYDNSGNHQGGTLL